MLGFESDDFELVGDELAQAQELLDFPSAQVPAEEEEPALEPPPLELPPFEEPYPSAYQPPPSNRKELREMIRCTVCPVNTS